MTTIGCPVIAQEGADYLDSITRGDFYEGSYAGDSHRAAKARSHPDWLPLGNGASRFTMLHVPTGVAYKFGYARHNQDEAENCARLNALSDHRYHVPMATAHTLDKNVTYFGEGSNRVVLAVEFAEAAISHENMPYCCGRRENEFARHKFDANCWSGVLSEISRIFHLCDAHYANIIFATDGRVWLVDLGEKMHH